MTFDQRPHTRKQVAALSAGSAVVGGLCYLGMLGARGRMLRARELA